MEALVNIGSGRDFGKRFGGQDGLTRFITDFEWSWHDEASIEGRLAFHFSF
jgi:hypothetical protein